MQRKYVSFARAWVNSQIIEYDLIGHEIIILLYGCGLPTVMVGVYFNCML
jgi:hypothetical protein